MAGPETIKPNSSAFTRESAEPETEGREKAIAEFLAQNLPPSEERITEPMNPRCEVCVVLPAYNERDYILRPLTSLAAQEGVSPDQYEVIVVVNNPPTPPTREEFADEEEYRSKVDSYSAAVADNQKTLGLIRHIKDEEVAVNLNEQETRAVQAIRQSGLRLFVVDKASAGKTFSPAEANVGGARNRGIAEAVERFYGQVRKNGILVHSDAEVRFSSTYIQGVTEIFKQDPELVGVTLTVEHEPAKDTDEIFRAISAYAEMKEEYEGLSNFLHRSNTLVKTVDFDGSNMASRAFETAMVNGIPKIAGAEDTYFGWNLAEIGKVKEGHEPTTTTMDRISSRTTTGRGLKTASYQDDVKEKGTVYVRNPEHASFEKQLKEKFFRAIESRQLTPEHLKQVLQINDQSILSEDELHLLSDALIKIVGQIPQASPAEIGSKLLDSKDQRISQFLNNIVIRARIDALVPEVPIEIAVSKLIEILSADSELRARYLSTKEKMVNEENQRISNRNSMLDKLCNIVFTENHQEILAQPLENVIRQHKTEVGVTDQQLKSLYAKDSIVSALSEIFRTSKTKQEAMERAHQVFQYTLSPLEQNERDLKLVEVRAMRNTVEERNHQNELLKDRLAEFLSAFDGNKNKIDRLTEIVHKGLDDELLRKIGLSLNAREIENRLGACVVIQNQDEFLGTVNDILSPVVNAMDNHPELAAEVRERIEAAFRDFKFIPINEVLSYGVGGSNLHIHLADVSDLSSGKKIASVIDGMNKLATIVQKNPMIETISATSWLVAKHPKLVERLGFKIEGPITDEMRQKYFKGEERPIDSSVMSREEFLAKYLKV